MAPSLFPEAQLLSVSLDTAVLGPGGDLDGGPALKFLMDIARRGWIGCNVTGPPCETWSAARHLPKPPEVKGRWPRPLRSAKNPWGVPHLSTKELHQLRVGSRLYLASVIAETCIALHGGCSIMEHPNRRGGDFPSTWDTIVEAHLTKLAGYQAPVVEQWKYGACSVKPTRLRALGMCLSGYTQILREEEDCRHPFPAEALQGVNQSGEFRTAAAKEYPTGLSKWLARTLLEEARARAKANLVAHVSVHPTDELFVHLQQLAATSSIIDEKADRLPDYQGP